ncbi:SDR family NAD(P)-dependent oxidoreductase [Sphingomonas bacterium]|uniref:SDR family NAD(P)-dependent oxidoreductase n=1 Tax=Sphingomonas bacterium TaxID=1895847 RepID=UPI001576A4FC|nr:SDR family NAD(P)-dependent oxidoreductase [Sphingomonas bacterium]
MAKVFITGSSQGLGLAAGRLLAVQGHEVMLHARNQARADDVHRVLPAAANVLVADVSTVASMRELANQANELGRFDAVIHNVAIGYREKRRIETADGLSQLWAVNVLAPYVLTALMTRPARLVYLSSELHRRVDGNLDDLQWAHRPWHGTRAYSDTKFQDALLAMAVARLWSGTLSNAVEPGWVPTRMGGPGATGDLAAGAVTQAWLATSDDTGARVTGGYFFHRRPARLHPAAGRTDLQDRLVARCAAVSGVDLP